MNPRISTYLYSIDGLGGNECSFENLSDLSDDTLDFQFISDLLETLEFEPSESSIKNILDFARNFKPSLD